MAPADPPVVHELRHRAVPSLLDDAGVMLAGVWDAHADVDQLDRAMVATAVAELVANIVAHGREASWATLSVEVKPTVIRAEVRDDGAALAADVVEAATLPDDPLAESGRGLVVARDAVDELRYERVGGENRWTVVRHRR
ncbi:MAG TPA: ATP-binding protein [Acidimicrobiales bacterium]|nr:ATP-binding protein [Acidimicrobiales bacterium]